MKLRNGYDLASNDHVRYFIIAKQQQLSERKCRNPANRQKGNSASSSLSSDVVSGSSEETFRVPIVDKKHCLIEDAHEKEVIDKCLKWMETLPEKFSGMTLFSTNESD